MTANYSIISDDVSERNYDTAIYYSRVILDRDAYRCRIQRVEVCGCAAIMVKIIDKRSRARCETFAAEDYVRMMGAKYCLRVMRNKLIIELMRKKG